MTGSAPSGSCCFRTPRISPPSAPPTSATSPRSSRRSSRAPNYPLIGAVDSNAPNLYGMLPAAVSGDPTKRPAADNQTVRNVFIIGPDNKVKLILVYPMAVGRNFDEVLRVIASLQLGAKHKVATPVNWKQGDDVIIAGSVTDDDDKQLFPHGSESPQPDILVVLEPQ